MVIHGQALNHDCLSIMADKHIYFCPTIQFLWEPYWEYKKYRSKKYGDNYERRGNSIKIKSSNDKVITLISSVSNVSIKWLI